MMIARLGRFLLWLIVTAMVLLAIAVTALRIALPRLDSYQNEIESWVNENTGIPFDVTSVKGYWRNTHPSIALENLEARFEGASAVSFSVKEVQIEFDLFGSLLAMEPQIANLSGHGLSLDISTIKLLGNGGHGESEAKGNNNTNPVLKQLDKLLLRQLQDFTLLDSEIKYLSFTGDARQLDIDMLKWQNRGARHQLDGIVSIAGSDINSLSVIADFDDHGSFADISGQFYVRAESVKVDPWLTEYLQQETGISSGEVSFNSWLSLSHNQPVDAYVELLPSELNWDFAKEQSSLFIEEGVFKLTPNYKIGGWKVNGHSLRIRSNEKEWPELDLAFDWEPDGWVFNLSQIDIEALLPLIHLMPESEFITSWTDKLGPKGILEDIRIAQNLKADTVNYSASLYNGGLKQWYLLPEVHELTADISGSKDAAKIRLGLIDDVLPYGDVFQAPLNIKQGAVDLVWHSEDDGWSIWADRVTVASPDLQALGAFRLDFPKEKPPFLSIYAEADLYNAGETWRYLPTLALGQELTDYLSTAIRGGKAKTAQILWHGDLGTFPYKDNSGVFQAKVGLRDGRFSFETSWPEITELKLDLLFENESMYLSSDSAKLVDIQADKITGRIPYLGPSGHIEIEAAATAKGNSVRDYMMSTPLVDSVGAALTAVQVRGNVQSEFQLNIPFSSKKEPRAWGYAKLKNNTVNIKTPAMTLKKARGTIVFDNDVVSTSGLSALLLDQPVSLDFKGENQSSGYGVGIDLLGDWDVEPLYPYVGKQWLERVHGHAPWAMDIELQLNDVGFTYQIDTKANLEYIASRYPAPLSRALGEKDTARMQASGNQESISARVQLPGAKYQTEIDITGVKPELTATNLLVGTGSFKVSPIVGHNFSIRIKDFDMDKWLEALGSSLEAKGETQLSKMNTPDIPSPEKMTIDVENLKLATLDWHNVDFQARKKDISWQIKLDSAEAQGQATYIEPYDLSVALERLHVFIPALEEEKEEDKPVFEAEGEQPLISEFDKTFHKEMPNLTLAIDDFWLQGYKVGKANVDLQRQENRLQLNRVELASGNNQVKINGWWELTEADSRSRFNLFLKGDDNTELMERFGVSAGIQRAPFEMSGDISWQGAPWSARTETFNGKVSSEFGSGVISDVSGAAKLLGLFSLDSIIRRMQLDFTDVFDEGLAFDSITGTGVLQDGVFYTNDIEMKALAGDMSIKGKADLNQRLVDAHVEFVPDLTSGLPVLTAFAVAPQTAVVVFAISTVISPVVDVFTKIRYEVKGSLDSPVVKEVSRSKGEYKIPAKSDEKKD